MVDWKLKSCAFECWAESLPSITHKPPGNAEKVGFSEKRSGILQQKLEMRERGGKHASFQRLIQDLQHERSHISIDQLVRRKNYDKRRLYDLFNVLTTVGICAKLEPKHFAWLGDDSVHDTCRAMAVDLELKCVVDKDDISVLRVDDNSHLSVIVTKFIQSFFYFGKDIVDVQDISLCMARSPGRSKLILRRLYLISQILEEVGVMQHTLARGKYKLCMDVLGIVKQAFRQLLSGNKLPIESVLAKMNDVDDDYLRRLHAERQHLLSVRKSRRSGSDELLSSNDKDDGDNPGPASS